jgi:hypothetical protein
MITRVYIARTSFILGRMTNSSGAGVAGMAGEPPK